MERFPFLCREQIIVRKAAEFDKQLEDALKSLRGKKDCESVSGFDIVLDALLGEFFAPAFDKMNPGGRHIVCVSFYFAHVTSCFRLSKNIRKLLFPPM
jgi:hypothetical protein